MPGYPFPKFFANVGSTCDPKTKFPNRRTRVGERWHANKFRESPRLRELSMSRHSKNLSSQILARKRNFPTAEGTKRHAKKLVSTQFVHEMPDMKSVRRNGARATRRREFVSRFTVRRERVKARARARARAANKCKATALHHATQHLNFLTASLREYREEIAHGARRYVHRADAHVQRVLSPAT